MGIEKPVQMAEKERTAVELGLKTEADPVFYISMVGADENGIFYEHEHIFDLYTKEYDFVGSNVHVITAQDLWKFYASKNKGMKLFNIFTLVEGVKREKVDIYFLISSNIILMATFSRYQIFPIPIECVFFKSGQSDYGRKFSDEFKQIHKTMPEAIGQGIKLVLGCFAIQFFI